MEIIDILLPIIFLIIFGFFTIPVLNLLRKRKKRYLLSLFWFLFGFIFSGALVVNVAINYYELSSQIPFLTFSLSDEPLNTVSSSFMIDSISVFMAIIIIGMGSVVLFYSYLYHGSENRPSERYYAIMFVLIAALIGTVFAGDLLTLFIFWEAAAAGSAFLMLYKKNPNSINSTLKYLIMIIIASAFIVFGLSLVYSLTGSLNFWIIKDVLLNLNDKTLLILAFIFISTGYAIESAIVPFHFWLPEAYTAAPSSSSAFLSALIDQGSYYVLIRVLIYILTPPDVLNWTLMLSIMAGLTMIIGNLFALIQDDVKRLIANICVADVGYNLVGITTLTTLGLLGNLYFFLIGGITTALSFMIVGVMNHYGFKSIKDFSGLGKKMPIMSLALVVAALSFAGVPPLGGFTAKFLVFTAAIRADLTWLAVIGVITSIIQTAYLMRLINYMYGKKPLNNKKIVEPKKLLIPIFIFVAAIIILGIYPQIIFDLIQNATQQPPFLFP